MSDVCTLYPDVLPYYVGQELPGLALAWLDGTNQPIDFSAGWTFQLRLINEGTGAVGLTKTTNIFGLSITPNVLIDWGNQELAIAPATYKVELTASNVAGQMRAFRPGRELRIKLLPIPA